ncbi:uncharacterized protein BJX67DRAFT_59112 [Aspergillus lucknowensis]|uniref:Uncharacterized protein n=1 Tax=Aspergillus lucknowensis TaxID=176173 RepID=A0ABR4LV83_9EURO
MIDSITTYPPSLPRSPNGRCLPVDSFPSPQVFGEMRDESPPSRHPRTLWRALGLCWKEHGERDTATPSKNHGPRHRAAPNPRVKVTFCDKRVIVDTSAMYQWVIRPSQVALSIILFWRIPCSADSVEPLQRETRAQVRNPIVIGSDSSRPFLLRGVSTGRGCLPSIAFPVFSHPDGLQTALWKPHYSPPLMGFCVPKKPGRGRWTPL